MPVDIYVGGMEHAIMHLLYARFIHKAICDVNDIQDEPGCITSFEKMSKSKGNGIAPEEISQMFGVDALRAAILFGAPPDTDLNFDHAAVASMYNYLQRVQ